MSLPPSMPGSEGVTVVPPTPTSSAPPALVRAAGEASDGGSTTKNGNEDKVLAPPPRIGRAIDSGVALEEVLSKALDLKSGGAGEEELERAEETRMARRPNAPSPHSSGTRSAGGVPSHRSQRPSPASRGSFSNSSRSGTSRTSSGGHQYDHSNRSSFERRPSQYGQPTQLPSLSAGQQWASPYAYSPNQRTPSAASSDLMYPLPAFYPSGSFGYPPPQNTYGNGNPIDLNSAQAYYQQQYGQPGFIAFHPFSSPLPSPRVDYPAHYNGGFPFSAAPSPQPVSYPFYPLPGVVYSTGRHVGTNGGNGTTIYDELGQEIGQSGGEQHQPHLAYYPQPQAPPTLPSALGYGPPQPPPGAVQAGGPYQPVYFAPPIVPSQGAPAAAHYHPPPPPTAPRPPSHPSAPSPPQLPIDGNGASLSPYPIYPIGNLPPPVALQNTHEASPHLPPLAPGAAPGPPPNFQPLIPCPPPPPLPFSTTGPALPLPLDYDSRRPSFATTDSRESSSGLSPSTHTSPKIYEPPSTPARGQLAQAGLRKAALQAGAVGGSELTPMQMRRVPSGGTAGGGGGGQTGRRDMPKPPPHSPHALWVGNVPSDASHAELWQFFQTRPVPSARGIIAAFGGEELDMSVTGIESIHLIARSNCAFVNYVSDVHLQHAIQVSNGVSLRPGDTRCKTFLCRERKSDDDVKSGVGAQRVGGLHKTYIREQREQMAERQRILAQQAALKVKGESESDAGARRQSVGSTASLGTSTGSGSTSSSFLTKHFERRYFILKSHDEADLRLSVETGLWATQSHNEPVLQQAYRTAKTVYLIFGANGQGCWFGVARMAGPISTATTSTGSRPSWSTRDGGSTTVSSAGAGATLLSQPSQTILEDEPSSFPARPPVLLGESERHFAANSPSGISPAAVLKHPTGAGSAPASLAPPVNVSNAARTAMSIEADLAARETADNLHLPEAIVAKRAASYDDVLERKAIEESGLRDHDGEDVTTRQGSLVLEAEKRNRKLEGIVDRTEEPKPTFAAAVASSRPSSQTTPRPSPIHAAWGTPFAVEWLTVQKLPFPQTKHLRNSFNGNREIKVSRDGTEVEPSAGAALLSVFCEEDPSVRQLLSPVTSARPSPATSRSAPSAVEAASGGFSFSPVTSTTVTPVPIPVARGLVGSMGSGSEESEK